MDAQALDEIGALAARAARRVDDPVGRLGDVAEEQRIHAHFDGLFQLLGGDVVPVNHDVLVGRVVREDRIRRAVLVRAGDLDDARGGPAPFDSVRFLPMIFAVSGAQVWRDDQGTVAGHEFKSQRRSVLTRRSAKPRIVGEFPVRTTTFARLPACCGYLTIGPSSPIAHPPAAECTVARRGRAPARRQTRRHRNRCCPAVPRRSNRSCRPGWHPDASRCWVRCRCWARLPASSYSSGLSLSGSISSPLSHCQPSPGSLEPGAWKPPIHDSLPGAFA